MTVAHICCSTSEFATWSRILYNSHKMSQVARACQEVSGVLNESSVGCKSCSQERQPAGSIWGLNEVCCTLNRARRLGLMMTKDQTGGCGGQGSGKRSLAFPKSRSCCSVAKSCPTLCDPMDCSTPGFLALHYLPEFAQIHVPWAADTT